MNAALAALPVPTRGTDAAARTVPPRIGQGSARTTPAFLGQLAQALDAANGDTAAANGPEHAAAPSQDGASLPQVAAPAQQAIKAALATLATPTGPAAPPETAQASPTISSSGTGERADAAGERRPASTRSDGSGKTRTDRQQEALPSPVALAVTLSPMPTPTLPASPAPDSPESHEAAVPTASDGPSPDMRPGARQLVETHDLAPLKGAEALQDAAGSAAPPGLFPQHLDPPSQPLLDASEGITAPPLAAPALPDIAASGIAGPAPQAGLPPTTTPAGPAHASPPGPAAQLTPALVQIAAAPDGGHRVTVRLDPIELGELRVRIERPRDGPVQVTVEATRPETLQLLRQDQPALNRALDQAGLSSDGRVVVLQQASPDSGQQQGASPEAGGTSSGGGQDGGRGGSQGWSRSGNGGDDTPQDHSRRRDAWLRAGINITA